MEDHQDQDASYDFSFDINGIYLMKGVVDYMIQVWPGSPQRPAEEQVFLMQMKTELAKCMMHHSFNNLSVDR